MRKQLLNALNAISLPQEPADLYEPMRYFLDLGGKRMRPLLVLMANRLFGGKDATAMGSALAVEVFHNFTLVHDDIMDDAPLRRGKETVHEKWGLNVAILSGDALLVKAYEQLATAPADKLPRLMSIFNRTALEVCEGQQYDMDFEQRDTISEDEYINMIRLKTAVLLGGALEMGAVLAGASQEDIERIYRFGVLTGIAFQLQDDILDVYADQADFGKQVAGDILAYKKTILLVKAQSNADAAAREKLDEAYRTGTDQEKVQNVMALYDQLSAREAAEALMRDYHTRALAELQAIQVDDDLKTDLEAFANMLLVRKV